MIDQSTYRAIKTKYCLHASWAVWEAQSDKPKSNMDDLTIFERKDILDTLNPNNILVAYNFSVDGKVNRPFENFKSHLLDGK